LAVYTPVWIDSVAPPDKQTAWFSYLQASTPVGVMLGYVAGFGAVSFDGDWADGKTPVSQCAFMDCWRYPFILQAILITPLCIGAFFVPSSAVNTARIMLDASDVPTPRHADEPDSPYATPTHSAATPQSARNRTLSAHGRDSIDIFNYHLTQEQTHLTGEGISRVRQESSWLYRAESQMQPENGSDTLSQIWTVIKEPRFTLVVLGLSSLFFVVTGIQFWATAYLIEVLRAPKEQVMSLFVFTSATAPILGVVFGGAFIDKIGGYKGSRQRAKAMRCVLFFGVLANVSAYLAWLQLPLVPVIVFIWLLLFFGAGCLPALTGIFIDAVPQDLKALGSSLSQISANLLGYALAPVLSGWLMNYFQHNFDSPVPHGCKGSAPGHCPQAFLWGFRVILSWSSVALVFIMATFFITECQRTKDAEEMEALGNGDGAEEALDNASSSYSLFDEASAPYDTPDKSKRERTSGASTASGSSVGSGRIPKTSGSRVESFPRGTTLSSIREAHLLADGNKPSNEKSPAIEAVPRPPYGATTVVTYDASKSYDHQAMSEEQYYEAMEAGSEGVRAGSVASPKV